MTKWANHFHNKKITLSDFQTYSNVEKIYDVLNVHIWLFLGFVRFCIDCLPTLDPFNISAIRPIMFAFSFEIDYPDFYLPGILSLYFWNFLRNSCSKPDIFI